MKERHQDELNNLEHLLKENFGIENSLQKEKSEEYIASLIEKHKEEIEEVFSVNINFKCNLKVFFLVENKSAQ